MKFFVASKLILIKLPQIMKFFVTSTKVNSDKITPNHEVFVASKLMLIKLPRIMKFFVASKLILIKVP